MVTPIPPIFKYSIVYNSLNFPPILIKFVSKFIVCKVLYYKAQYILRLCSPLNVKWILIRFTVLIHLIVYALKLSMLSLDGERDFFKNFI